MTERERMLINEMRNHLGELHEKWQSDLGGYGSSKSNEGYIGILYRYDNWFECGSDKAKYINKKPEISMVEVYSYLFGPNRLHSFDSVDEAYNEVMSWKY